jgi:hypothetical protein
MGAAEVTDFLNHLCRDRRVAASTQNQALAALLFLYRHVRGTSSSSSRLCAPLAGSESG